MNFCRVCNMSTEKSTPITEADCFCLYCDGTRTFGEEQERRLNRYGYTMTFVSGMCVPKPIRMSHPLEAD